MFIINYSINSDDLNPSDLEPEIHGFIELLIGDKVYGCYPKSPVPFEGSDLLSTWFEQLSETACLLNSHPTILINDITSYNTWLGFSKNEEDYVVISELLSDKPEGSKSIEIRSILEVELGEINHVKIGIAEFKKEVYIKTSQFLNEVLMSNPQYRQMPWVIRIQDNLSKIF